MNKEIVIIGAGKIGRGFISHLFYRSGYKIWLVDSSPELVRKLNEKKKFRIDIAGEITDKTEYISLEGAFTLDDRSGVMDIFQRVGIIATSVGARNIEAVTNYVRDLLIATKRNEILNWLICENATNPARKIKKILLRNADPSFVNLVQSKIGLVETQILRTGMSAKEEIGIADPLALRMQDWWVLPFDQDGFIGEIPGVEGLRPRPGFANELTRKLYTFNGTNAAIAYVGWANGFRILHESALAYRKFFESIQDEAAFGLIHEFRLNETEQKDFMALAMKKYTDPALADKIERNANDTKRKLGKDERLVGPALLCLKHGRMPNAFAIAIAAAYYYTGSADHGTREVQKTIESLGIEAAIKLHSDLDEVSPLFKLVIEAYNKKTFMMPRA